MPLTTLAPGAVLQQTYRIVRRIGGGGMGEVYEATHQRLAGRYAVKVLGAEMAGHPEALLRFRREAQVTSSLQHPGIVQVVDFNQTAEGVPYLVMEYLDGKDLAQVIAESAPLPPLRVADMVEQMASALAAAHRRGIVHRDLKPQNVFVLSVDGKDVVKLVDFGISKMRNASQQLTREVALLGTPQYMAPEQAKGNMAEVDEKRNLFALAAIAYEMLAGRPAFTGESLAAVVYQIAHLDPPSLSAPPSSAVPPTVDAVVRRGLEKRREARFASVLDLAAALKAAARGQTTALLPLGADATGDCVSDGRTLVMPGGSPLSTRPLPETPPRVPEHAPEHARLAGADDDASTLPAPFPGAGGGSASPARPDTTLGATTGQLGGPGARRPRRGVRAIVIVAVTGATVALVAAALLRPAPTDDGAGAKSPRAASASPASSSPGSSLPPAPPAADAPVGRTAPASVPAAGRGPAAPATADDEGSAVNAPPAGDGTAGAAKRGAHARSKRGGASRTERRKSGEALVDDL